MTVFRKLGPVRFIGLVALLVCSACSTTDPLDQNWSSSEQTTWFEADQGSRLIPLAWFVALEQEKSDALFLTDENIRRYGYEPRTLSNSTIRLPRGFVLNKTVDDSLTWTRLRWRTDQAEKEPWVGMNCSGCHTATIRYQGATLTVYGAPANTDFQSFFEAFDAALAQTAADPAKFARFADRVLQDAGASPAAKLENRKQLAAALATLNQHEARIAALNQTDLRYGYGRLDAVGHILNKVALLTAADPLAPHPADAPVSYPFLWNVPRLDFVEWNGMAANGRLPGAGGRGLDVDALGRNTGEVIGVFADVVAVKDPGLAGYKSSVDVDSLVGIEDQLRKLRPPKWPDKLFGAPKADAVKAGADLFEKRHCAECHQLLKDRTDLDTPIKTQMVKLVPEAGRAAIGTDPWMACNAYFYAGPTGVMEGLGETSGSGKVGAQDKLANLLALDVQEVLLGKKFDLVDLAVIGFLGIEPPPVIVAAPGGRPPIEGALPTGPAAEKVRRQLECKGKNDKLLAYKARSLNGIWATAPYLHNGSVPTLYELLLAPDQRKARFAPGSAGFDPQKVGLTTLAPGDPTPAFDTSLPGNSNLGHDYGVGSLSDEERSALLEFMKTL